MWPIGKTNTRYVMTKQNKRRRTASIAFIFCFYSSESGGERGERARAGSGGGDTISRRVVQVREFIAGKKPGRDIFQKTADGVLPQKIRDRELPKI